MEGIRNHQAYITRILKVSTLSLKNMSDKLIQATYKNMHQIYAYNGQHLPWHDLIFAVTEVQHDACGDDFRDGEHKVMLKVVVKVLVVVAEVRPPGVVVGVQVDQVQVKHAGS